MKLKVITFFLIINAVILLWAYSSHRHQLNTMQNCKSLMQECQAELDSIPQRLNITITAYTPRPCETDSTPFITASNQRVREGIVALSRDLERRLGLKFGDTIVIAGLGKFEFQDRMHKRKKMQVDIFMWDLQAAREFGVQKGILIF